MTRALALLYALLAYGVFFVVFLWFVAFVGDIRAVGDIVQVPSTVDYNPIIGEGMGPAVVINLALIAIFGIHHSVAARMGFKDKLTRTLPKSVERSTYVLVASLLLALLMYYWHPMEGSIWNLEGTMFEMPMWVVFAAGWFILFTSTWLLNHFELFGLQQAWHHGSAEGIPPQEMRTPLYYKLVRHPIYLGFFIAIWAAVEMSTGHLVMAVGMTIYILIGIHYEEKDLLAFFGDKYADYRTKVGSLLPGIGKSR